MSNQITTAFVNKYTNVVKHLLQQKGSKLRKSVMVQQCHGEGAKIVEQVGSVNPRKRTTRHADSPLIETPHAARWVFPQDYDWGDLIDDPDKVRTIAEFSSPYAQNAMYALGRAIDDEIILAATGTANVGKTGSDTEAFAASQQVTTAGGLTVAKLREARLKLAQAEVDTENEKLWFVGKAKQQDNLLGDALAISQDYTDRPVLVDGRIRSFMGFEFIWTERVLAGTAGGAHDRCFCYPQSGMALGIWDDIMTRITERSDKSFSTYVYAKGTFGATRTELRKVVEVQCF